MIYRAIKESAKYNSCIDRLLILNYFYHFVSLRCIFPCNRTVALLAFAFYTMLISNKTYHILFIFPCLRFLY